PVTHPPGGFLARLRPGVLSLGHCLQQARPPSVREAPHAGRHGFLMSTRRRALPLLLLAAVLTAGFAAGAPGDGDRPGDLPPPLALHAGDIIWAVAWSPDGRRVAAAC